MNKFIKLITIVAAAISASAATSTVYADGFYISAGVYQANAELNTVEDNDIIPAAFAGYNFLNTSIVMASAEVGIYDLGGYKKNNFNIDSSAITLAGVGYIPIGPFIEIYAKAGVAAVAIDVKTLTTDYDENSTEMFGGLGASIDILDIIDIYAEYLVFDTEIDSTLAGVGVRFDF